MAQKLWEKSVQVNKDIERFTVGRDREMDLYLAKHDVLGSMAHITMLESIGLLTKEELEQLLAELKTIYASVERGEFIIEEGVEDVHSQVELMLTRRLGDVGKKIHSGRSRNDQVLLDLKLFTRTQIREIAEAVEQLFHVLILQSERYKNVLMPGYTHLQIAMPSSFGLWFGAYAESLVDDMQFLQAAFRMCNRNPLGSAAGYGSSFPLNRTMTTDLLGFDSLNYNVVYAQMGRGKLERNVAFALATIAGTISKLAFDACMFNSQNFGFVKLPDDCTTGSSIMPHKKNPDVFELTRAKCNKLQSLPQQIMMIANNLPSGYFRDLQIIKEVFLPAFQELTFKDIAYDVDDYPLWVDTAIIKLREIARLDALVSTLRKQEALLEKELRSTSQRVNLFEKVKIPEAKENIRMIGVFLGDQQTAAVVRGKISKKKLVEAAQ